MKVLPVGDELFHKDGPSDEETDRRPDMTKLTVHFRNYVNMRKNTEYTCQSSQ